MARPNSHLRLVVEPSHPSATEPAAVRFAGMASLCDAFQQATGWDLRFEEQAGPETNELWSATIAQPNGKLSRLVVDRPFSHDAAAPSEIDTLLAFDHVRPLALAIGSLLGELAETRHTLWKREAELAAGVPVNAKPDEEHLANRLEAVLQGGVDAVNADAAGLYLLDEATTTLKLRAMHNLPRNKFLEPARPLRGSVADLEALIGHAVVLEDTAKLPQWKCPENYPSAICVPISSPTMPLGTMWIYSRTQRDFSPEQTNLLEIVAGRIAADLEREVLLSAGLSAKQADRSLAAATTFFRERLPRFSPLNDDWNLAGWTNEFAPAGEFFDWNVLPDGRIAFALASLTDHRPASALHAAALQAAWRSHAPYNRSAASLLTRLNESLWSASAGETGLALFSGAIDPEIGRLDCAAAGGGTAILLRSDGARSLRLEAPPLGVEPERQYRGRAFPMQENDILLLLSPGVTALCDEGGLRIGESSLVNLLRRHRSRPADQLSRVLQESLQRRIGDKPSPAAFLVVKREG